MNIETIRSRVFLRGMSLIILSTVILTSAFVGIVAFLSGDITGLDSRLPYYTVFLGMSFVLMITLLESHETRGKDILVTAILVSLLSTLITILAVEGIFFAVRFPERVFVSQLVVYFVGASLVAIGLGYWGLNHWREFVETGGL